MARPINSGANRGRENDPIEWDEAIKHAVTQSAALDLPEDEGLSQVMARIRASSNQQHAQQIKTLEKRSQGWLEWFGMLISPRPLMASMAAVLVAQLAIIVSIWPNQQLSDEYAGYRSNSQHAGIHQPFIRVSFKSDVRESDIRMLLRQAEAEIVAGPSQIGEYYLLGLKGESAGVFETLSGQAVIESIALVDQLPASGY